MLSNGATVRNETAPITSQSVEVSKDMALEEMNHIQDPVITKFEKQK